MHKDKGFAPVILLIVIVMFAMALAQCDVRHASAADNPSTKHTGGAR